MLGQPCVDLRPIISIIRGTEHAIPVTASKQCATRSGQQPVDTVPCVQSVLNQLPVVSIVRRAENSAITTKTVNVAACENIAVPIDGKRKDAEIR